MVPNQTRSTSEAYGNPKRTSSMVVALGPAGYISFLIQPNRIISTSARATAMTALMLCSPSSRTRKDSATGS